MATHSQSRVFEDTHINQFGKCRVLLFEAEADFRRHTREMLIEMGFDNILDTGEFEGFQSAFGSGKFDLIIGDTSAARGNVCDLVRRIRHNVYGVDPFPGVILTMADPSEEKIRQAAESGTDHLIAKPYSPNQVLERIQTIVEERKRFIVTLNYVGPERREGYQNSSPDELIMVPNALRAKARNDPSALATPETVRAAMNRINRLKVQRHALEIGVLVEMLRSAPSSDVSGRSESRLRKMAELVTTLQSILPATEFGEAAPMCEGMQVVIHDISKADSLTKPELNRLEETSMALHLCFHPEKTVSNITREIADAVAAIGKRSRKAL
ncbi:MAG: response regulator [Rhodospirillales bacterium]|nr:response regulator [Rhodospirillales bacterium]